MFNIFTIKRWISIILPCFLCVLSFSVGLFFYNFWYALIFFAVALILSFFISSLLQRNPFTQMLEGKGILVFNIDSTGIIKPFIVGVHSPFIKGKFKGNEVKDVFDREATAHLAPPEKIMQKAETKNGILNIVIDEKQFNKAKFAFFHYPVLIFNEQVGSIITKDFLGSGEKEAFAEHGVLYLNRKMEELTSIIRDFSRYIVEMTKPKGNILGSKWFWIILVVGLIALAALFLPSIISTIKASMGTAVDTMAKTSGATIVPK